VASEFSPSTLDISGRGLKTKNWSSFPSRPKAWVFAVMLALLDAPPMTAPVTASKVSEAGEPVVTDPTSTGGIAA
jgi:hypothetical protein